MNKLTLTDIAMVGWVFDLRVHSDKNGGYAVTYKGSVVGHIHGYGEQLEDSIEDAAAAAAEAHGSRNRYFIRQAIKKIRDELYDLKQMEVRHG